MTTKKIVFIVVGIFVGLALLVVLFAAGIAWFALHTISNSAAAEQARSYLRNNETLKRDIGEVKSFGYFVTGNVATRNSDGEATLHFKVYGERKTVNATVDLSYRDNRNWRVTGASYESDGHRIFLMAPYDMAPEASPPPE